MATDSLTIIHTLISLIGIVAGFVVLGGMFRSEKVAGWTEAFLLFTILTSVTGYFFPYTGPTPALVVGAISLLVLLFAVHALYGRQLQGSARGTYVVCAVLAQYLNVFVLVAQFFQRVPFLHRPGAHRGGDSLQDRPGPGDAPLHLVRNPRLPELPSRAGTDRLGRRSPVQLPGLSAVDGC